MNAILDNPLLLLFGGASFAGILLLSMFLFDGGRRKEKQRIERLRQRGRGGEVAPELKLRRNSHDKRMIDDLMRRFLPRPELLRERLKRTGRKIGLGTYGLSCLGIGLIASIAIYFTGLSWVFIVFGSILVGLWFPHLFVGVMAGRRAMRFTVLFPEAIGLMVRSIKSGLPITESFQIVGNEITDPVGMEFRMVSDQIKLGQPIDKVLWDAAQRVHTPEMKFLVVTLSVQRETGGNLAETLENLDNILRRRRQMRLKIKAMSSEAKASAMIIGSLPFLMMTTLTIINYDYISLLFTHPTGHMLLGIAAGMMGTGIVVMAKMVKFEI